MLPLDPGQKEEKPIMMKYDDYVCSFLGVAGLVSGTSGQIYVYIYVYMLLLFPRL